MDDAGAARGAPRRRHGGPDGARRARRLGQRRHPSRASTSSDLAADAAAARGARRGPGSGVMSEESGRPRRRPAGRRGARPGRRQHQRQPRPALVRHQPVRGRRATAPGPRWWSTRPAARGSRRSRGGGARGRRRSRCVPSACTTLGDADRRAVGLPAALVRVEAVPGPRRRRPRPVRGGRRAPRRLRRLQPERPRRLGLPRRAARLPGGRAPSSSTPSAASSSPLDHAARRTPVAAGHAGAARRRRWRPAGASSTRSRGPRSARSYPERVLGRLHSLAARACSAACRCRPGGGSCARSRPRTRWARSA